MMSNDKEFENFFIDTFVNELSFKANPVLIEYLLLVWDHQQKIIDKKDAEIERLKSELTKRDELLKEARKVIITLDNKYFEDNLTLTQKIESTLQKLKPYSDITNLKGDRYENRHKRE